MPRRTSAERKQRTAEVRKFREDRDRLEEECIALKLLPVHSARTAALPHLRALLAAYETAARRSDGRYGEAGAAAALVD